MTLRRLALVAGALLVLAPPGPAKDGPKSPVPRKVEEAPRSVWKSLRDPFFGPYLKPNGGMPLKRWQRWKRNLPEATAWIEANPAEARFIRAHQKLAAWAKTYPKKANWVDEHPEIVQWFARNPEARRRFPEHPTVKKRFAEKKPPPPGSQGENGKKKPGDIIPRRGPDGDL